MEASVLTACGMKQGYCSGAHALLAGVPGVRRTVGIGARSTVAQSFGDRGGSAIIKAPIRGSLADCPVVYLSEPTNAEAENSRDAMSLPIASSESGAAIGGAVQCSFPWLLLKQGVGLL
jgi:hypothetical protein